MALGIALTAVSLLQAPVQAEDSVDVAYEEMAAQQNAAAIRKIEANEALDREDPARSINLAIAYAREGRSEEARALLNATAQFETRYRLETASGEWMDSRRLAMRALAMLDRGVFTDRARMAAR